MFKVLARCALFSFALLPCAAAAEPVKLQLAFYTSDRTAAYRSAVRPFVDAVNAEANGLLEIQVNFSGALGKSQAKTAHGVLSGVADIAFVVPSLAPDLFYDNTIIELPGLFRDSHEATVVFTRLLAANTLKGYEDFFVIGSFANGPETIHMRPPVAALDDLKGKKIGTNNETEAAALEKLGMQPVILPVTEFSDAITSGRVDGVGKSPSILIDFGVARVATNHYFLGTSAIPLLLLMNRKVFDALPAPSQDIIRKHSGKWAAARFVDFNVAANAQAIRLRTEDGTLVPPLVFIPVAEDIRLIDKIGAWVLREACCTAATWPEHLTVAVNLSPAQFLTGSVSDIVAAALKETGLAAHRLELEITETLLLGNSEAIMAELQALKAMGVAIVMDDFGTGYSSLSYLWRFPFDKIKIDRSFMQGFDGSGRDAETVVKTIIALGRELNMRVTVEGVETAEQAAFLDTADGDQAQGFFFGRPVPASEIGASILADFQKTLPKPLFSTAREAKTRVG